MTSGLAAGRWGESARWLERRQGTTRLRSGIAVSAAVHALALAAALFWRSPKTPPAPPVYAVSLVAAPPGPRAIGVVDPEPPAAAAPQPKPTEEVTPPRPAAAEARPEAMKVPVKAKVPPKTPPRATPTPATTKKPATPKPAATKPATRPATRPEATPGAKPGATGSTAPRAGGGPEGGRGTDVANVQIAGLQFPYRGYLDNIVRQVALRFSPPTRNALLQADVSFLIHRNGSVSDIRVVKPSGNRLFDIEARGAVEAAGQALAFGPLPEGFREDVLPVTFSFDPRIIR